MAADATPGREPETVPDRACEPGAWRCGLLLCLVAALVGSKWELIQHHGSDVPYGDQWYGEVTTLYLPYVKGEFTAAHLVAPHNEHRIVLTRLLDLFLLEANGQWDPRLQLLAGALVLAAAVGTLVAATTRSLPPLATAVTSVLALGLFSNPVLWENTLNGFQSQFYFLILFALLHILLTTGSRPLGGPWWIGQLAGVLSLLCMALGFIGPLAVLLWLGWRVRAGFRERRDLWLAVWNAGLLVAGGLLLHLETSPAQPGSMAWTKLPQVCLEIMSWPMPRWNLELFLYAPLLVLLIRETIRPSRTLFVGMVVALACFALLHVGAIAAARGALASRYGDLLAVGLMASFLSWFALFRTGRWRLAGIALGSLWLAVVVTGLFRGGTYHESMHHLQGLSAGHDTRTASFRAYQVSGDIGQLEKNPDFSGLDTISIRDALAEPRFRKILPLSLRPPIATRIDSDADRPEAPGRHGTPVLTGLTDDVPRWSTADLPATHAPEEIRRHYVATEFPVVTVYLAGTLQPPDTTVHLVAENGQRVPPLQETLQASSRWRRLNFPNPGGPFQLVARDASAESWLAVSEPFAVGRLTRFTGKLTGLGVPLKVAGWTGLLALSAWAIFRSLRERPRWK